MKGRGWVLLAFVACTDEDPSYRAARGAPFVIDGDDIYVFYGGAMRVTRKASGDERLLASVRSLESFPGEAAVSRDYVITNAGGKTVRIKKTGGDPEIVRESACHNVVVADETVYCTGRAEGSVFDVLVAVPVGGGTERVISKELVDVFVVDGDAVYASTVREIVRIDLASGQSKQLAAVSTDLITGLAVDEMDVYFSDAPGEGTRGAIRRVAKVGGEVGTLVELAEPARQIAVDATHVYWPDNGILGVRKSGGPYVSLANIGAETPPSHRGARTIQLDATHVFWLVGDALGEGVVNRVEKVRP